MHVCVYIHYPRVINIFVDTVSKLITVAYPAGLRVLKHPPKLNINYCNLLDSWELHEPEPALH